MKYLKITWQSKIKIILTDDHALFRKGVRMALDKWSDIEIIGEAANGQELLDLLETVVPDIVILNITMPVMNGLETLPRIKKKYPDLKVIVLSMHNDPRMIVKMMSMDANSYLTKNIDGARICEAIRCVHEYGYHYSDAIKNALLSDIPKIEFQKPDFTYKESQILNFVKEKKTIKEMADILDLSEQTVTAILHRLIGKNKL